MTATLDIDLLRTFHAVARLGRFNAAAEAVHRSPGAISVQIQRLEALAGGRLLERDNRGVSLTPLGERLLGATAPVLQAHDRALDEIRDAGLVGRVRLGVPDEYAASCIASILPLFSQAHPEVALEVSTAPSFALAGLIERARLELAIVARPLDGRRRDPAPLALTTPVWAIAATAPQSLPSPLPVALHANHCPYRAAMIAALDGAGIGWRPALVSPSSQAIIACVEAGLAVGVLDRHQLTPRMRVLARGLPRLPGHEVVLLAADGALDDPAAARLEALLRERFSL